MKLHDYLKRNKISQYLFADLIHVSQAAVYRYANGLRIPEEDIMPRIFEATLGTVTANDFYDLPTTKPKRKR